MVSNYWVFKTEPAECSMQDIANAGETGVIWEGVRNYQARNFLRDQVRPGDLILIHHSSCANIGIAGIAKVLAPSFADPSQFLADSPYYDPKASLEKAPWVAVRVGADTLFQRIVSLAELRQVAGLQDMLLLKKGNRLSIMPATKAEFDLVLSTVKA